ncbi:MAG: hypothetical protein HQM09_22845 [Candidatus Riflebacteria bacterium]|nr:hypothetical protein [Candidatus Riflebacteria bacterium]
MNIQSNGQINGSDQGQTPKQIVEIDFSDIYRILSATTRVKTFFWKGGIRETFDIAESHRPEWPVKGIIVQIAGENELGISDISRILLPFEQLTRFEESDDESPIVFGVATEALPAGTIQVKAVLSG